MKNVMVFSCGAIPAIDINIALRGNNDYKIYGASSYDDHGLYVYENYIGGVPFIYENNFIEKFNDIIHKYKIDFIIPLHEDIILFMQEHKEEIDAVIISSCYETAFLCRYKTKTYQALNGFDFVPKVYQVDEVMEFPVFVKKDNDQGARHAYQVNNAEQLLFYAKQADMIICEYLPGEEVTVDCFTDRHGKLRLVNPRVADRILAGIDVHTRRLPQDTEINDIAEKINGRIKYRGPWFFQIKRNRNGKYKLLETSSRFAGAFGLTRCMDINTPLMAIRDFDNKDVNFDFNDKPIEADKMFIGRYTIPVEYDKIVIDGTDCMCIGSLIDTFFMMFLYQCINKEKKLILLSNDIEKDKFKLHEKRIAPSVFAQILEVGNYLDIDYTNAVFISRNELNRVSVRKRHNIYCYDATAVEVLLDWRG